MFLVTTSSRYLSGVFLMKSHPKNTCPSLQKTLFGKIFIFLFFKFFLALPQANNDMVWIWNAENEVLFCHMANNSHSFSMAISVHDETTHVLEWKERFSCKVT